MQRCDTVVEQAEEKPNPGREGTTTWKAGWEAGGWVRREMRFANSQNAPVGGGAPGG